MNKHQGKIYEIAKISYKMLLADNLIEGHVNINFKEHYKKIKSIYGKSYIVHLEGGIVKVLYNKAL